MKEPYQDRAKQFMPFAALRGFEEMVGDRAKVLEPRRELSDDETERINAILSEIAKGDYVRVKHYNVDCYIITEGFLTDIDPVFRTLTVGQRKISFDELISILKLEE